jgi:putative radical SAM enzyme (TIGR03279 family)
VTAAAPGVAVAAVEAGSPAWRKGVRKGDRVLSVDGKPVEDLLDLHYLTSRSRFRLRWLHGGVELEAPFRPGEEPLGIAPEPIRVRRCRNRCVFCFVHQLPKGLRRSLYVKDEDVRLSFLHGQYVTLSDATEEEVGKILRYRLSPLYVSVHAADDALRRRMLGNGGAAPILPLLARLAAGGIRMETQVVLVPGWNDGAVLADTVRSLARLRPAVESLAVVPVGLTSHRGGLPPLAPVTPTLARETLSLLSSLDRELGREGEGPFATAGDEFFLLAGRPVPGRGYYGDYPQAENGVGLLRLFREGEGRVLRRKSLPPLQGGTVVTGLSAEATVRRFLERLSAKTGADFETLAVPNRLLGPTVTVTGLLSGRDVLYALDGRRPRLLYLPEVTLRQEGDRFLDDLAPGDLSRATGGEVRLFPPDPEGFLAAASRTGTNIQSFR